MHSEKGGLLATVQHTKRKPLIENDEKLSNLFMAFVIAALLFKVHMTRNFFLRFSVLQYL